MYPVCSFCGEGPVVAWFEGPDFTVSVDGPEKVRAEEAWLACSTCLLLVEAGDRDSLVRRGVGRLRGDQRDLENVSAAVRLSHEQFLAGCGDG